MNIEMALKSRSYILDLDHVKLSLEIFFLLGCLMESLLHQLSGYTFIFVKNTHQKAANFTFRLILPAPMVSWWFLGVQYIINWRQYATLNQCIMTRIQEGDKLVALTIVAWQEAGSHNGQSTLFIWFLDPNNDIVGRLDQLQQQANTGKCLPALEATESKQCELSREQILVFKTCI